MARCRSCDAEIIWATSAQTGKPMPVDAQPSAKGNLAIVAGKAHYYGAEDERLHRERFVSHFATCTEADSWRQAR